MCCTPYIICKTCSNSVVSSIEKHSFLAWSLDSIKITTHLRPDRIPLLFRFCLSVHFPIRREIRREYSYIL